MAGEIFELDVPESMPQPQGTGTFEKIPTGQRGKVFELPVRGRIFELPAPGATIPTGQELPAPPKEPERLGFLGTSAKVGSETVKNLASFGDMIAAIPHSLYAFEATMAARINAVVRGKTPVEQGAEADEAFTSIMASAPK